MRGGEGAMIAAAKDPNGKLVVIQLTYLQPDGSRSPIIPQRVTWRGPHDWSSRGVVWLNAYDGSGEVIVCEGVEDGLCLVAAGAANVAAILGVGRLGKVLWPWGVRRLVIARDDDAPGTTGDNALYRGVIRQRGEGLSAYILLRPRMLAPNANVTIKDANDLHLHDPTKVWEWLERAGDRARRSEPGSAQRGARRSLAPVRRAI